jgi:Big-like domain-containing protein
VGDASFLPGDAAPVTVSVAKGATTSTVSASPAAIAPGGAITLTANISTGTSAAFPTGTVAFFSGTTPVGTASFINGNLQNGIDNGVATLMTTSLPTGSDSVTAQYSGDSNYAASTTPAIPVNVSLQPDFTFSFAPATISVASPGLSGTTMLTVAGSSGFSGATTFSCAGLPSESSCSFMPPTVTGSGTTTLTVTTTAPSSVVPGSRNDFPNWRPAGASLRSLVFCIGLLVLGICARRRRLKVIGGGIGAVMLIVGLAACGGGGGGGVTPPANPGTPMVQNQTVTVTATSGTLTHTTTFTLNVN